MSGSIKIRLAAFVLAIGLMITLIAWTALSSLREITELQRKLNAGQLKSFQIAAHFQQTILKLNNTVLRYGVSRDTNEWVSFDKDSSALEGWIGDQRAILTSEEERAILSEEERAILDQIDVAYKDYVKAARQIHTRFSTDTHPTNRLGEFAGFERQSQHILRLALNLADAHRDSMDAFLDQSNKSLDHLRVLLLSSLLLLLLAGAGLAVVVYRGMIAPLQVKLVESQQLVERQEKLASLGMLAAGVAHEIRNPLTALKAWLFIQQKHLQPGTPEHEDAELIGKEISRLERIVRDFLTFARPSEPQLELVAADKPLREVETLLAPELGKANIRILVSDSPSARVRLDPQQIKQVLINLVQNAADSIGHNGDITLRARLDTRPLAERPTEVVVLEVSDTGKGIPPEVERRLFDPFFTTKESGTGLGLSIAARIVEKHGGALQYQTQVNRGTIFGIVLPRA